MKDFNVTEYVFFPGVSGAGYVDLYNLSDFDITRVVAIINQTKGVVIYATGSASKRYTSISGNKVYLFYDTSSHSATDKLQIVYNTSKSLKTSDTDTQEMIKLLSRLVKIAENQQSTDSAQRQRMIVDNTSLTVTQATATNLNATVSIAASQTLATVTNLATTANMGQEQFINIARNAYANSIRNKIFFS
jgi:hypothetical protein